MKSKCHTCDKYLTETQKKYCCHHCLCIGANKARVVKMHETRIERFWSKVKKGPKCWLWLGAIGNRGYGQIKFEGKVELAHRVAWTITHTPPGELCVLHSCDNPPCVNPSHLFLGTKQDNSDDMVNKGRSYPRDGQLNPNNKLTPEQINQIRNLKGKLKQTEIANMFGIIQPHVSRILRGEAWKPKH